MRILLILNDSPSASRRSQTALQIGTALSQDYRCMVRAFLVGDAVACCKVSPDTASSSSDTRAEMERMIMNGVPVGVCGVSMDANGITDAELPNDAHRSTTAVLSDWVTWANKVMVF